MVGSQNPSRLASYVAAVSIPTGIHFVFAAATRGQIYVSRRGDYHVTAKQRGLSPLQDPDTSLYLVHAL